MAFHRFLLFVLFFGVLHMAAGQVSPEEAAFEQAYTLYKAHHYLQAIALCESAGSHNRERTAACLLIKGFVLTDSISFDTGKPYFEKAGRELRGSTAFKLVAKVHFGLGKGYYNHAQYLESIQEFLKLEKLAVAHKMKPEEKSANFYLAEDFQALNKVPVSNRYAKRGILLSKELNDTASILRNYLVWINNFSITGYQYLNSGAAGKTEDFAIANRYGDSALLALAEMERYTQPNEAHQLGSVCNLYSGAYACKRDYKKHVQYAILSFRNFEASGDRNNAIIACNKIGDAFIELAKYDSALHYMKKAETMKKGMASGYALADDRNFHYALFRAYRGLGRYKEAMESLVKYLEQDLVLNESRNIDLQKIREEFEAEKTSLKIKTETERARQLFEQKRKFYLLSSIGVLSGLLFLAWFLYYRYKSRKEREEKNLKILVQHAELTALKAQMNPHFIFNALNSIQHSIVSNNTEDAYRFLSKFSKLIRHVLDSSSAQLISLKTEIETLTLYLEIESKRFDHSFSFGVQTEPVDAPIETLSIPPMILQPFIENAIWHGLMPKEGEKKLQIVFSVLGEETLVCRISDNGIGRAEAKKIADAKGKKHTSRGIANIMDRVKLLEMTHALRVQIRIQDETDPLGQANGTTVEVKFTQERKTT